MNAQELAEALCAEVLPASARMGRLLADADYAEVVVGTIDYASSNQMRVRGTLLAAVQAAIDDDVFDPDDAAGLRSDLAVLRTSPAWS